MVENGCHVSSVSYTHLDVYKRQMLCFRHVLLKSMCKEVFVTCFFGVSVFVDEICFVCSIIVVLIIHLFFHSTNTYLKMNFFL